MKILNKLSFHKKIFLACLLTALVPLLCSSVVMIRLFTAALSKQNLDEGRTQITKAEARLEAVFEKCEEACKTIATDKKTARIMIEKSEADHQREMYLSLYQATQETSGYARFSIYDSGGHLRYTTDTEGRKDLPVFWGLLRKASERMILYITGLIRIFLLRTGTFCFRVQDRCIQKAVQKPAILFLILQGKTWMIF